MAKDTLLINVDSAILGRHATHLTGVGRTTVDLLTALQEEELPFEIILYWQSLRGNPVALNDIKFRKKKALFPAGLISNLKLFTINPSEICIQHTLHHIPHNFGFVSRPASTVLTIHDAMFFSYPEEFLGHALLRQRLPELAQKCKSIVTCSESSKYDIIRYMHIPDEKVEVIPWGVSDRIFYPEEPSTVKKALDNWGISRPYFMMVSCDLGRKNTLTLIHAYKNYLNQKSDHDLVLLWANPPETIQELCKSEVDAGRIHFCQGVSTDELRALYSGATLTFFPSKYEGFGLPILESMACGTGVVTCNNSSLHEVGGDTAYYIHPDVEGEYIEYMKLFAVNGKDYQHTISSSLAHASLYTWEKTAKAYIRFYERNL